MTAVETRHVLRIATLAVNMAVRIAARHYGIDATEIADELTLLCLS